MKFYSVTDGRYVDITMADEPGVRGVCSEGCTMTDPETGKEVPQPLAFLNPDVRTLKIRVPCTNRRCRPVRDERQYMVVLDDGRKFQCPNCKGTGVVECFRTFVLPQKDPDDNPIMICEQCEAKETASRHVHHRQEPLGSGAFDSLSEVDVDVPEEEESEEVEVSEVVEGENEND